MIKTRNKAILCAIATIALINQPTSIEASAMTSKSVVAKSSTTKMEVVNTNSLNVRKSASAKSTKLGTLKKGQKVEVISISKGWAKINFNKKTAYVSSDYLKTIKKETFKKREMKAKASITVRKGASSKQKSLGKLKKGNVVIAIAETNGWLKIEYKGGYGYIQNSNLEKGVYVADRDSANKVISQINNFKKGVKLSDKPKVEKARKAYDSLNKNAKKLVTNLKVLQDSETKISKLEKDDKEIKKVITQIDDFKKGVKLSDKPKVEKARKAYNSLSKDAKKLVTNLKVLQDSETKISNLEKVDEEVQAVITQIDALKIDVTLSDKSKVEKARKAYNSLSEDAKKLVTNLEILNQAEVKIKEFEESKNIQAQAEVVIKQIDKLDKVITLNDKKSIEETRSSYVKLNSNAKKLVTNINVLEKAESILGQIRHAIELTRNLPYDITLEHRSQVQEARNAYDVLTPEAQKSISSFDHSILISAEVKIKELDLVNKDTAIANDLIKQIDNLSSKVDSNTIEYKDEEIIKNIRNKFDNLIWVAQDIVIEANYSKFLEAELQLSNIYGNIIFVEYLIDELPSPENIKLEDKADLDTANEKYNKLGNNKVGVNKTLVDKLILANSVMNKLEDSVN